jgi:hypothetical protein
MKSTAKEILQSCISSLRARHRRDGAQVTVSDAQNKRKLHFVKCNSAHVSSNHAQASGTHALVSTDPARSKRIHAQFNRILAQCNAELLL